MGSKKRKRKRKGAFKSRKCPARIAETSAPFPSGPDVHRITCGANDNESDILAR